MAGITATGDKSETTHIYHERQRLQFCLLHALNNLCQSREAFTRADLDSIANELTRIDPDEARWNPVSFVWKPHHNTLTGNYDINVLFAALERKGKRVVWHDKRNGAALMDLKSSSEMLLTGIIVNKSVPRWRGLWNNRHWIALKQIDDIWYNLDSDLPRPLRFQNGEEDLRRFLDQSLAEGGEILLVYEENPAAQGSKQK
eukprot:TRINITY_DN4847_c0_g1_i1.p1 TRINITY_DN4847_c0_g1~~TRINITY_DN4847_c0_g1_i1.p1  ORF type:complete len:222 (-),score=26.01 TRINITY_DN4847_c0_g1_i1:79-681(-)